MPDDPITEAELLEGEVVDPGPAPGETGAALELAMTRAVPALARAGFGLWWRTTGWTVEAAVRGGGRVARGAVSGESPTELVEAIGHEARDYARRMLGVADLEERMRRIVRTSAGVPPSAIAHEEDGRAPSLRERGGALLARSADVDYEEAAHPAYVRILDEMAPDEARILRLLALRGPQPAVDVRTSQGLSVKSQLVAPGLSMIGQEAGCRYVERVPAYLNNLERLGLVWFSREPLEDPLDYQVLEAQPDVVEALKRGSRGRTVRRSIHLTPFGEDFCRTCLPIDPAPATAQALPGPATDGAAAAARDGAGASPPGPAPGPSPASVPRSSPAGAPTPRPPREAPWPT